MKYDFDRSFKFKVNDDVWEAYLITKEEAKELDEILSEDEDKIEEGEDFPAMISPTKKCFFLVEGNINPEIIGHELVHIYVDYMCVGSAELDVDQFEEVIAEFFQYNLEKFIKKRNQIYRQYKKLERS